MNCRSSQWFCIFLVNDKLHGKKVKTSMPGVILVRVYLWWHAPYSMYSTRTTQLLNSIIQLSLLSQTIPNTNATCHPHNLSLASVSWIRVGQFWHCKLCFLRISLKVGRIHKEVNVQGSKQRSDRNSHLGKHFSNIISTKILFDSLTFFLFLTFSSCLLLFLLV